MVGRPIHLNRGLIARYIRLFRPGGQQPGTYYYWKKSVSLIGLLKRWLLVEKSTTEYGTRRAKRLVGTFSSFS